jgi:hypothetical protein
LRVTVSEAGTVTTHEVTIGAADIEHLGGAPEARIVEASLRFLLDREPKESILRHFDLSVISRSSPTARGHSRPTAEGGERRLTRIPPLLTR